MGIILTTRGDLSDSHHYSSNPTHLMWARLFRLKLRRCRLPGFQANFDHVPRVTNVLYRAEIITIFCTLMKRLEVSPNRLKYRVQIRKRFEKSMQNGRRPVAILNVCKLLESVWVGCAEHQIWRKKGFGAESYKLWREASR